MIGKWTYETGVETAEILGSGSNYSFVFESFDFDEALKESKLLRRNYFVRKIYKDKRFTTEYYDRDTQKFS